MPQKVLNSLQCFNNIKKSLKSLLILKLAILSVLSSADSPLPCFFSFSNRFFSFSSSFFLLFSSSFSLFSRSFSSFDFFPVPRISKVAESPAASPSPSGKISMASYKISLSNFIEQTLYQRKTQKYKRLK
jgi:hypothetical protein